MKTKKRHRIFITGSGIAEEAQKLLRNNNCTFEVGNPEDTPKDIARKLRAFNPDGIVVRQGRITGEVQDAAESLKVICKHGVGTDNIDIEAATKRGIPVMFTPKANYESAAEHTLALILALIRKIPVQDRHIRNGIFDKENFDGTELLGKTLGLIGFGPIARRLSQLVALFNMNVLVYHPSCTPEPLPQNISKVPKLESIFSSADIISLHCPLTPKTRNLINKQTIAQMKEGVYIINTARGRIVNESDLFHALQNNRIRGAALDVFEIEPPPVNSPLFKLDNVVLTAHIAGVSDKSIRDMGMEAVGNVLAVLNGDTIDTESLVNNEVILRQKGNI